MITIAHITHILHMHADDALALSITMAIAALAVIAATKKGNK